MIHTHTPMTTTHKKLTPCKACGSTGKAHDSEDGGNWISCSNIMCMASTSIYYSCGEDCRPRMNDNEGWHSELQKLIKQNQQDRLNNPSKCLHNACPRCQGSGVDKVTGMHCIHGISCQCRSCSPIAFGSML